MKQKTKNPVGAPKKLKDGRAAHVWLDSATLTKAEKIGGGSISSGIRLAVGAYDDVAKTYARLNGEIA